MKTKAVLESCITEKVRSLSCLDTYDDNRLQLQKESLRVAVEGFENIIAFLSELAGDMMTLSQVLYFYSASASSCTMYNTSVVLMDDDSPFSSRSCRTMPPSRWITHTG